MTVGEHPQVRTRRLKLPEPESALARMAEWRRRARREVQLLSGAAKPSQVPNGVVMWHGPSLITGEEVLVVAIGFRAASSNPKTGDLVQLYIVPRAIRPGDAARDGTDAAVCGNCPLRPSKGGACYVTAFWAPTRVWECATDDRYPWVSPGGGRILLAGSDVRLGSWGDPAAVPIEVWDELLAEIHGWSGYTHRWRDIDPAAGWARLLMASCDSIEDQREASAAGWRTFRVDWEGAGPLDQERRCLAEEHGVPCLACRGCDGTSRGAGRASFVIGPHGWRVEGGRAKG